MEEVYRSARYEGDSAGRFIWLMRKYGYNKVVDIRFGTVLEGPPSIRVQLDNMKMELEWDDLVVAEHLTNRKEEVTLRLKEGQLDSVTDVAEGHRHNLETFELLKGEIEYHRELKAGDRVAVGELKDGQMFFIVDRLVTYKGEG